MKLSSWLKLNVVPLIAVPFLKLLTKTWRLEWIGPRFEEIIAKQNVIIAVWHGRLLLTACILRNRNIHVMVSDHEDGEMITRIVQKLGFVAVRGSSTRGGVKAAMSASEAIASGFPGGMLPDGPTGPRHKAKLGTVWLAAETKTAILPVSASAEKGWQFYRSWDKFLVAKPFSRVVFSVGAPLLVTDTNDGKKHANRELEKVLTELEHRSDERCNRTVLLESHEL